MWAVSLTSNEIMALTPGAMGSDILQVAFKAVGDLLRSQTLLMSILQPASSSWTGFWHKARGGINIQE